MTSQRITGRVAVAAAGTLLFALAGCSAADGETSPTTAAPADSSGVATAQSEVEKYTDLVDGFLPSDPLTDSSSLSGKTVVYIPAVAQIPFFATSYAAVQEAFAVVGIKVEICDAQANPANASACLDQALNTGAAGVILDALPPALAQESFDAVVEAGLPVILGNIPVPEGSPDTVQRVGPDTVLATSLAANAIIADSGGDANALVVRVIDSPVTQSWVDEGAMVTFPENCPDCEVTVVDTKTADLQSLPAKVSAALLADGDIDYLLPQLSPEIVPTVQGATDAGKPDLPAASTATTLGDLQMIEAGDPLFASVGWDVVRTGWLEADVLMRLILGMPVDATEYVSPLRIFSEANVGELELTDEGWATSQWFGGDDYQATLTELWK